MIINENFKNKVIIIAENDNKLAEEISSFLKEQGFINIRMADDGSKIYEILRPYYNDPDQIGLIIVNENLAHCHIMEMCLTLSSGENGSIVPFIIFSNDKRNINDLNQEDHELLSNGLIHYMPPPKEFSKFLLVVGFQLMMKHERSLRNKQEERLINELAERKLVDAKLKYLVVHDELTGLLNRQNFERQLRQLLNRSNMLQLNGALLYIDIDRFSLINELEGFEIGDRLLVEIVAIFRKLAFKKDLLARIGSDEFCIFLENKSTKEVKHFAEKIRQAVFEHRFLAGDVCYSISLSIGLTDLNTRTSVYHPSELISRAQKACTMAKDHGRNIVWLHNENDTKVQERHKDVYWVPLIRKALLERSFFLVFQPVVDLTNGDISHYEVLIRMRGMDNEVISPGDFIPVAERMGLIHSIDLWVVEKSIDYLAELSSDLSNVSLAINLSSMAFQDDSLFPAIRNKLELTWVDPRRITFEITETAAIENFEQTRTMIANIRALGCKFALDDFGAGFCSFNYLKTFPVDYVKIDGQFIQNLLDDETDQVLVKSMSDIATNLGKKTIAEFVETPETIHKLREIGINLGQGYIFGKPQTVLLDNNNMSLNTLISNSPNHAQTLVKN